MPVSLVTGGAGFIGSHVAEYLLKLGHKVIILDDLSGGFTTNVPTDAEFVNGSILDNKLINGLFEKHRFDYVYHLAAYAAEGLSHFIRRFNYHNNLIGSVNLINAAVNFEVKCFVFTSSIAVYGAGTPPLKETNLPVPEDPYGIAKLAVEQDLKTAQKMFGLNHVIFRPHNVYGERQNIGDRYRNVVGIFMNQALRGEPMSIFGDGLQQRAFTYIDDVAPVIAESVNTPLAYNEIFNIGADQPSTVSDLATIVSQAMGTPLDLKHLEERQEVKYAWSDHTKIDHVFGQRSTVNLADGINRMATWVKANGTRESDTFTDIEIQKNLPLSWKSPGIS